MNLWLVNCLIWPHRLGVIIVFRENIAIAA